jgi:hypothetical protein
MKDKSIDTIFGYIIIGVLGYFVVKALFPYLLMAILGLLMLRYLNHRK